MTRREKKPATGINTESRYPATARLRTTPSQRIATEDWPNAERGVRRALETYLAIPTFIRQGRSIKV